MLLNISKQIVPLIERMGHAEKNTAFLDYVLLGCEILCSHVSDHRAAALPITFTTHYPVQQP
jgi:hypothetical protein